MTMPAGKPYREAVSRRDPNPIMSRDPKMAIPRCTHVSEIFPDGQGFQKSLLAEYGQQTRY